MDELSKPEGESTPGISETEVTSGIMPPQKRKFFIPVWVGIFLLLVVLLEVFCMLRFSDAFSEYRVYMTAEEKIANGETSTAILDLYNLSSKHQNSLKVVTKTIDLSMKYGYYDVAAYEMDNYLAGMNLDTSTYSRMSTYAAQLKKYYKTRNAIDAIMKDKTDPNDPNSADYTAITTSLKELLKLSGQDDAVIHYYLSFVSGNDIESAKNELQQCYDMNPECFDVRVQLGVMYRQLGDYEKTKELNQEALRKDKSDSEALRSAAVVQMLEGDIKGGVSTAKKAYEADPDGIYIRDTYLISLTLDNQKEAAQKIQDEITAKGGTLDTDTIQLLNGNISLHDFYVRG